MSEISKYEAYKKKMQGLCDEHNLIFRFRRDAYPITLTIRPVGGVAAQMTMLEDAEANGYISPDAAIVFAIKDGNLTYKMSETFSISDALFSKIKNLFKNMHYTWLQFFFKDVIEKQALSTQQMPQIDDDDDGDDGELPSDAALMEDIEAEDLPDVDELDVGESEVDVDPDAQLFDGSDPLVIEATRVVRHQNKATTGLLQRHLHIGYEKASRLMDSLEALGVVGPFNGSDPREVLPFDEPDDGDEEGTGDGADEA